MLGSNGLAPLPHLIDAVVIELDVGAVSLDQFVDVRYFVALLSQSQRQPVTVFGTQMGDVTIDGHFLQIDRGNFYQQRPQAAI